jgi:hypothetical protein
MPAGFYLLLSFAGITEELKNISKSEPRKNVERMILFSFFQVYYEYK